MPRFSANLTMLWNELPVLDRFRAAAAAGFRRVEILFVHDLDPAAVEAALREYGLELWLFDPRPGGSTRSPASPRASRRKRRERLPFQTCARPRRSLPPTESRSWSRRSTTPTCRATTPRR